MPNIFTRRAWLRSSAFTGAALVLLPNEIRADTAATQQKLIKLSGNENPYGFSPRARQAIVDALGEGNRYADPDVVKQLEEMIAGREGLKPENVVLATGSGEILCMAAIAFGRAEIVAPDPTFPTLMQYATKLGANVKPIPLKAKFEHDLDAMAKAITEQTSIVYVCNPNNPTGGITPNPALTAFCRETATRTPVFVDEAYLEYTAEFPRNSMIDLVRRGEKVIVSRTFSKIYGMAGLRVGYGLANTELAQRLRNFRMTWLNHISIRAAIAAFQDQSFVEDSRRRNNEVRRQFLAALDQMKLQYAPSDANFVWLNIGPGQADLAIKMKQHNIMLGNSRPPASDWVRVTIGTPTEMTAFTRALKTIMGVRS